MNDQQIDIRWIIYLLRRWGWLIALITILVSFVAILVTSRQSPVYQSSTTLMVSPAQNSTTNQYTDLIASERLALTYSHMVTDQLVLNGVISQLKLNLSPDELAKKIVATPISNTQLIQITVSDSNPEQAAIIARTLAEVFKTKIEALSSERYSTAITNAQDRVNTMQNQVGSDETILDSLNSQKVVKEAAHANYQAELDTLRQDNLTLQENNRQIQQTIAEATGKVYIFEPVQVKADQGRSSSTASAMIIIGQNQAVSGTGATTPVQYDTYTQLLFKTSILESIIEKHGLKETPDQLASKISITQIDGTPFFRLSVANIDSSKAEVIGNELVDTFIKQYKDLLAAPYADQLSVVQAKIEDITKSIETIQSQIEIINGEIAQLAFFIDRQEALLTVHRTDFRDAQKNLEDTRLVAANTLDTVIISQPAAVPNKPKQNVNLIFLAFVLGLCISSMIVFIFGYFDDRIVSRRDAIRKLQLPVLGTIGHYKNRTDELVAATNENSISSDDFRILSTNIRLLCEKNLIHQLLITSPTANEGKSVISSNLAVSLAKTGLRVILVDADLRLSKVHRLFNVDQKGGLIDALRNGEIDPFIKDTMFERLGVITSGEVVDNPTDLLNTPHLHDFFKKLNGSADIVLIDCPPILVTGDTLSISTTVDKVLIVLRSGKVKNEIAKEAIDVLKQNRVDIMGIVLNDVFPREINYPNYYHNNIEKKEVINS